MTTILKTPTTYEQVKKRINLYEQACKFQTNILNSYPKQPSGMVADSDRDKRYIETKRLYNQNFKELRKCNAYKVKHFKAECKQERLAKYNTK